MALCLECIKEHSDHNICETNEFRAKINNLIMEIEP